MQPNYYLKYMTFLDYSQKLNVTCKKAISRVASYTLNYSEKIHNFIRVFCI